MSHNSLSTKYENICSLYYFAALSFKAIEVASKLVNLVADSISEPEDIVDVMEITLSIFSDESTAISQTTDGVVRARFTVTEFTVTDFGFDIDVGSKIEFNLVSRWC